jgi:hypothetical protein
MKAHGIDRCMLVSSAATHLRLQRLIVEEQLQREQAAAVAVAAATGRIRLVISDRSMLDALAYAAERVGENSAEVSPCTTNCSTLKDVAALFLHCVSSTPRRLTQHFKVA